MPGAGRTRRPPGLKRKVPTSRQVRPKRSGTPCAMVYGLLRALAGVPGLLASVAHEIAHELDPSIGGPRPHDLTVRIGAHRLTRFRVHRSPHHES